MNRLPWCPSGDDDLFINKVANKKNTAIVIDADAITLSEPKNNFSEWIKQKNRHYTTAKFYKPRHKFLLGLYSVSQLLFYPTFIAAIIFFDWRFVLGVFVLRMISLYFIYVNGMRKLNEKDLTAWVFFFDLWQFFYYLLFIPAVLRKPRRTW